jgi:hypothetical protein
VDDFDGEWGEILKLVGGGPAGFLGIGGAGQRAAGDSTEKIDQDIVIAHAACLIARDAVEGLHDIDDLDHDAGLLEDLAADGLFEGFAELDRAARQRPLAFEGLLSAPDEENLPRSVRDVAEDDGSDTGDGSVGIFAFHTNRVQEQKRAADAPSGSAAIRVRA